MVFLGSQAVASPLWRLVTQYFGLRAVVVAVACLVALSAVTGLRLKVPESQHLDRSPVAYWGAAAVALEPEPDAGQIIVSIEYEVSPDRELDFLSAMDSMRRSRMRSGASRWNLHRIGERPDLFVEQFQVQTWREHQRQHDGRLTAEDQAIEEAALTHIVGTPRTQRLLPVTTPRDCLSPSRARPPASLAAPAAPD